MNESDSLRRPADPLGAGFDATDREIDQLLAELLCEGMDIPNGLGARVFDASAVYLPDRVVARTAAGPLRYVPAVTQRTIVRRRIFSRIAMAASVALVCTAGLKVCLPATAAPSRVAATTADWDVFNGAETGFGSVSHLLGASNTSLDDVTRSMMMLARAGDSEM